MCRSAKASGIRFIDHKVLTDMAYKSHVCIYIYNVEPLAFLPHFSLEIALAWDDLLVSSAHPPRSQLVRARGEARLSQRNQPFQLTANTHTTATTPAAGAAGGSPPAD